MAINHKVSSDIDTFLRKSTKEEAATFLGLEDTKAQWGQITGTLTNQSDLVAELALKGSASQQTTNTADISTNTANIATNATNITANTSNISTNTSNIATNTSDIATNTSDIADNAQAINVKADKSNSTLTGTTTVTKLVTGEIQCPTSGTLPTDASPINYDATEHRFRDYDESPSNLMVIKKINYVSGARVGINIPANQNPKVALHIAYGGSSNGLVREALRVSGGAFFNEWVRIGHYTDSERDNNIANPTNGTIIYNIDHHEFQGYIGGGQGSASRWQAFTMQNVST